MTHIVDVQYASSVPELPDSDQFSNWAGAALRDVEEPCELSIRIVDEEEGARLNEHWRKKAGPTNVLSFPAGTGLELAPRLLGDIVICAPIICREASVQGKAPQDHWAHMVIHGTLHLLGYDHEKGDKEATLMENKEIEILEQLKIANPYD